jgi:hypothetical protein
MNADNFIARLSDDAAQNDGIESVQQNPHWWSPVVIRVHPRNPRRISLLRLA